MKEKIKSLVDESINLCIYGYKFFRKGIFLGGFFIFSFIFFSNVFIILHSNERITENLTDLEKKKVGLVLGTSKYVVGDTGLINLFYRERIEAANELIESGKVEFLILSGTNDSPFYNEPEVMKEDLMELGVSKDKIFLDYAGFRTLDSILRVKEIFSQSNIIIVSQKFHLQRAITIASVNGIDSFGYIADSPPFSLVYKTYVREVFSRVKFLLDILIQKKARFYGDKIVIE